MARTPSPVTVSVATVDTVSLLITDGVLDSSTYLQLRGNVIKAALEEPRAVLVEVSNLEVPAASAWSVFTSARWHVSTWPDVAILLVCSRPDTAEQIAETGVSRYVPVYRDVETALGSLGNGPLPRRRARIELPHAANSLRSSRELVAAWLSDWSQEQLIPTAKVVIDVLVENVLRHTESAPVVVLENWDSTVAIAVQDTATAPAVRRETVAGDTDRVSGLAVLSALCRAWGSSATPGGKTVWATIGPDNRL